MTFTWFVSVQEDDVTIHGWLSAILSTPTISEHTAVTATVVARHLRRCGADEIDESPTERGVYRQAARLKLPTVQIDADRATA